MYVKKLFNFLYLRTTTAFYLIFIEKASFVEVWINLVKLLSCIVMNIFYKKFKIDNKNHYLNSLEQLTDKLVAHC